MVQCKEYFSKKYYANFFGTYLKMVLLRNSTMQGGVMQGLPVEVYQYLLVITEPPQLCAHLVEDTNCPRETIQGNCLIVTSSL